MKTSTAAQYARESAGLTLDQAAKRARVGRSYLRAIELHGGASYVLAMRLSHLYHCSIHVFI